MSASDSESSDSGEGRRIKRGPTRMLSGYLADEESSQQQLNSQGSYFSSSQATIDTDESQLPRTPIFAPQQRSKKRKLNETDHCLPVDLNQTELDTLKANLSGLGEEKLKHLLIKCVTHVPGAAAFLVKSLSDTAEATKPDDAIRTTSDANK